MTGAVEASRRSAPTARLLHATGRDRLVVANTLGLPLVTGAGRWAACWRMRMGREGEQRAALPPPGRRGAHAHCMRARTVRNVSLRGIAAAAPVLIASIPRIPLSGPVSCPSCPIDYARATVRETVVGPQPARVAARGLVVELDP